MADETLISALQALRENYSQKQKATNSLLAALKGKSSALGKIQQSLGDYTARNPGDNATMTPVQQLFSAAPEATNPLVATLSREAKVYATLTGALKGVIGALSTDPVDVVKLSHPMDTLKTLDVRDDQLTALLPALNAEMNKAQEALGAVFGAALRDAFIAQGIDVRGTAPRFEVGRFEIFANFLSRAATISYGKEVVIKRVPLSVEAVIKAYQNAAKSVTGRAENPEAWMAQFYNAWDKARRQRDETNQRANIVECYFEMVMLRQPKLFFSTPTKNGFAEYTRAQFAYDLNEIAIRPQRTYKGLVVFAHVATKSQTDSAAKSMWIVEGAGPHDGRYIGDIVFDRNE